MKSQQLLDRIEMAASIANWDAAVAAAAAPPGADQDAREALGRVAGAKRRCEELYLCLRGGALSWYHTLGDFPGFDANNWETLKTEFLEAYAPKYTARTLCVSLQDLRQKPEEAVQDYYNRVAESFRTAFKDKPDDLTICDDGILGGTAQDLANTIHLAGVIQMQLYTMKTIFIGGLKEDIRSKVLEDETKTVTMKDTLKRARAVEVLLGGEKRSKGHVIASIDQEANQWSQKNLLSSQKTTR